MKEKSSQIVKNWAQCVQGTNYFFLHLVSDTGKQITVSMYVPLDYGEDVSEYWKANTNLKLGNQELKTKQDIFGNRLDQDSKKINDLTAENGNFKLTNQELKAKLDIVSNRLNQEEKKNNNLVNQIASLKGCLVRLQNQANGIKHDVLTTIQNNGLRIGNRWVMREQGSNSYQALVFRDLNCGRDCRYAFYAGRIRDP